MVMKSDEHFQEQLAFGRIAETDIARWIKNRGSAILPVYAIENEEAFKGPRLFSLDGDLVVPDLLVFGVKGLRWIEAKHKTRFAWYRKTQQWNTGIDLHHYHQYLKVQEKTAVQVWLLFLHRCSDPSYADLSWNCPPECPTGLFGNALNALKDTAREDRRWARGMVYWGRKDLIKLAPLHEVSLAAAPEAAT